MDSPSTQRLSLGFPDEEIPCCLRLNWHQNLAVAVLPQRFDPLERLFEEEFRLNSLAIV